MNLSSFLRSVGANVAARRKDRSLTQKETADLARISYRYYQSIEGGVANITLSTLFKLARLLEVPPASLLRDSGEAK